MVWNILTGVFALAYMVIALLYRHVHMMQQNGYRVDRYWQWYKVRIIKDTRYTEVLLLIPLILGFFSKVACAIAAIVVFAFLLFISWPRPARDKKPLVFTGRAKRLYLLSAILMTAKVVSFIFVIHHGALLMFLLLLLCYFSRYYMLMAALILIPIENMINNRYLNDAKQKIARLPDLKRIGITGSFGKTSAKMIMAALLSEKYQTLATPASYNTPMGITKVIREQLSAVDEVFIAEMGAKQKGDIAELCELVHPSIGVLTAIGEQHLETFGSIETIIDTKFELLTSLPKDGIAIVNGDDARIMANISQSPVKVLTYGFAEQNDYWADQISHDEKGVSFTFHHGEIAESFSSVLLGRHMISNILAALAVADQLGLSPEEMRRGVKALPAIAHRLQLSSSGGFFILDDAFNSNPTGAEAAMEVLAAFADSKKIIITPGMVELGEREYQLNFELGQKMAKVADYIILVGKTHSQPLQDGVAAANYPPEQLYVAEDLADARRRMAKVVEEKAVVLFENDLPDTYNE